MMMKVSLSEHAKQPLSLPLPPKVFFHLSLTSFTPCSWLSSWSCEHCVSCTLPIITTISSLFKSSSPLFLFFSLWFKPHIPWSSFTWYCDCVVVLQFILVHVVMCCTNCCEHIIWCSFFWFLFFVFFDSVAFPILLLQLVVNQTREMESKWNFHTQKRTERQKLRCFVFKLDLKWVWFPVELHIGSVVFSKLYLFHSGQKSH